MHSILLFVKAPVAGLVKTRLYPELAPNRAAELYRALAQDTVDAARFVADARVVIAYEPHAEFPTPEWLRGAADWFSQRGASLGDRLTHAVAETYRRSPSPVIVIGTDLPGLTPQILNESRWLLRDNDVVLGPASDGGYYLIGLERPRPVLFENIPWSSSSVLEATLRILAQIELSFVQLPLMHDLDTPEDLRRLLSDPGQLSPHFRQTKEALHACYAL